MAAPPVAMPIPKKPKSADMGQEQVDAKLVMELPGTQLFKLESNKKKLKETGTLKVFTSHADLSQPGRPEDILYILHLGEFRMALMPDVPSMEMCTGNFVFPRPNKSSSWGIVLSPQVGLETIESFTSIIQNFSAYRHSGVVLPIQEIQEQKDVVTTGTMSVAKGIDSGGKAIANGLVKGGQIVGKYIHKSSAFLITKIKPNAAARPVPESHKKRLQQVQAVSGAACKISKALLVAAISTASVLSKELANAFNESDYGKKLAANPSPRVEAAKKVAVSTLGAVGNIYIGLETAGLALLADAGSATVNVITHKYGDETGAAAKQGVGVVHNFAQSSVNMASVGIEAVALQSIEGGIVHSIGDESDRKAYIERTQVDAVTVTSSTKEVAAMNDNPKAVAAMTTISAYNDIQSAFQPSTFSTPSSSSQAQTGAYPQLK